MRKPRKPDQFGEFQLHRRSGDVPLVFLLEPAGSRNGSHDFRSPMKASGELNRLPDFS